MQPDKPRKIQSDGKDQTQEVRGLFCKGLIAQSIAMPLPERQSGWKQLLRTLKTTVVLHFLLL